MNQKYIFSFSHVALFLQKYGGDQLQMKDPSHFSSELFPPSSSPLYLPPFLPSL